MLHKQSMHKYFLLFFLAGCSAIGTEKKAEFNTPSPEADLSAPGMIPTECEALLQKSQEWGYQPGESWKPASLDQAKDVAAFLANFTIVPDSSSKFWNAWKNLDPSKTELEAKRKVDLALRAQICDIPLVSFFLLGVMQYKWPNKSDEPKSFTHRFLLNQQARAGTIAVRAFTVEILEAAAKKRLIQMSRGASIPQLRQKLEKARTALEALSQDQSSQGAEKTLRKDLELSEELRQEIARFLPLP